MRAALAEAIERLGCEVIAALPDGRGLPDVVARLAPDLVLLDIFLPGRSGLELAADLRAAHARLPLLFISSSEDPELAATCLAIADTAMLPKRRLATELGPMLRRLLQ